jgi:hypothetical protein
MSDDRDRTLAALLRLVEDTVVREAAESVDRPHMMAITQVNGLITFEGPFQDGLAALIAADQRASEFTAGGEWFDDDLADDLSVLSVRVGPIDRPPATR